MHPAKRLFLLSAFLFSAATLTGCESVDTAMHDMKQRIAAIDIDWPDLPDMTHSDTVTVNDDDTQDGAYQQQAAAYISDDLTMRAEAPVAADNMAAQTPQDNVYSVVTAVNTPQDDCLPITIVPELNALHQFDNPDRPVPSGRVSSIAFTGLEAACTHNESNIVVELNMTFEGRLGPRARIWDTDRPSFAYPYFVAITDPSGNVLAKEVFAATVSYENGEDRLEHRETMRQIIPVTGRFDNKHEILVGFQLTEGELAYNRSLMDGPAAVSNEPYIESAAGAPAAAPLAINIKPPVKPDFIPASTVKTKPKSAPKLTPQTVSETIATTIEAPVVETPVMPQTDSPAIAPVEVKTPGVSMTTETVPVKAEIKKAMPVEPAPESMPEPATDIEVEVELEATSPSESKPASSVIDITAD